MADEEKIAEAERRTGRLEALRSAQSSENAQGPRSTYTNQHEDEGGVRIENFTAGGILMVAVLFDTMQAFLFFVPIGILFQLILGLWFMRLGVNYFTGRRAAIKVFTLFFTLLFGFVPVLNMLPEITLGTVVMLAVSRIEDTVGSHNQLMRIARRRVAGRQRLVERNGNRLAAKKERYGKNQNGVEKTEQEKRRGGRELAAYDRKTKRESIGMGARAVFGIKKRAVNGQGGQKRKGEELSRAGFYDPEEAEGEIDMNEAKKQAVREWRKAYEKKKQGEERT